MGMLELVLWWFVDSYFVLPSGVEHIQKLLCGFYYSDVIVSVII